MWCNSQGKQKNNFLFVFFSYIEFNQSEVPMHITIQIAAM